MLVGIHRVDEYTGQLIVVRLYALNAARTAHSFVAAFR